MEVEGDGDGYDDGGMVGGMGTVNGGGVRMMGDEGGKDRKEKIGGKLGMGDGEG